LNEQLTDNDKKMQVNSILREKFKPEFINRIDEIITFSPLTIENLAKIVEIQTASLKKRVEEQGMTLTICSMLNIPTQFIEVGTWRHNIGINTGDKSREAKKIKSIQKANELFDLNLPINYTKGGKYKEEGSDDISDSILLYCSTRNKYKVKTTTFGKKKGV
jgi:hypothetical protein